MKVTKRDSTKQDYDIKKVKGAIYKAFKEKYGEVDEHLERDIDDITLRVYEKRYDGINVETIQDMVESEIMSSEYFDVAKLYILYRKEKTDERSKEWEMNELQKDIYNSKYRYEKESFDDFINRVSGGNSEVAKAIRKREFMPAGRVLAGRGLSDKGVKISLTNCFFIEAPEDNIPSIMQTASDMAVTYSRGGGCGTDISKLRPRDAKVNNAARSSTGAVSFMELYSLVTGLISMKGRRGALLLSMSIDHPDIMEFIDIKTNLDNVTNANISVKITDEFMEKVENNEEHIMEFFVESTGETIRRTVRAKDLLYKLAENNHRSGEPGMLFWDNITNWSIMSEDDDYEYAGTNPCVTGETIVAVADGRNGVPIKDLVGQEFPVYSGRYSNNKGSSINNDKWVTEIKSATAFKTGTKEVVTIKLSDGSEFECTPDHQLALADGDYIEAQFSKGMRLGKFFSFSEKNNEKSYRHINSKTSKRQYQMMGNYYGLYDTSMNRPTIHHIDNDSTNDNISNLQCIEFDSHMKDFSDSQKENNTMKKDLNFNYNQALRSVRGNAKRYGWDKSRLLKREQELFEQYKPNLDIKDKNVNFEYDIFVEDVIYEGKVVDVYDLNVEDNHNFYIITQTDDDKFLNSSGVLIHNCGEQPLINGGSCNLASINLSKLAVNPFTDKAYVDFDKLKYLTDLGIRYLDEVVDDNIKNQPLEIQRQMAEKYRNCGLGFLGLSDLLIKMGYEYGKEESINLVDKIGRTMIEQALLTSTQLAEEKGTFPGCNVDAILQAPFVQENATEEILERIQNYGLRNSSLLSIAPTGSISILCGASSGGIEPLFQISYNRTTKSLHGEDRVYKVYADVVAELMEVQGIENEEELPDYVVTSSNVDYKDRIKMQSTVQKYIDTAISSTINLPEDTAVETIADIYYESWKANLKGTTIWRTNCERAGILTLDAQNEKKPDEVKKDPILKLDNSCPICGSQLEHVNGCKQCSNSDCHYGACDI